MKLMMLKSIFVVLALSGYSHAIQVDSGGGTAGATTDASELTSGYLANDRLRPDSTDYIQNSDSLQSGSTFYVSSASVDGQTLLAVTNGKVGIHHGSPIFALHVSSGPSSSTEGIYPEIRVTNERTTGSSFAAISVEAGAVIAKMLADGVGTTPLFNNQQAAGNGTKTNHSFYIYTNNSGRVSFNANGMVAFIDNGPGFLNENTSQTNPTLVPDRSNLTTGIGAHSSGNILDLISSNNLVTVIDGRSGAANYFYFASTATGFSPTIQSSGTDANIDMVFMPKGTGTANFSTTTTYGLLPLVFRVAPTGLEGNIVRFQDSDGTCDHDPDAAVEVVTCSSDENMKENIMDANSALVELKKMRIRQFDIKQSGNHVPFGPVAQEFELVPDMLMVEQPNPWGLVKAIQELEAELASLKERVAILEAK